MSKLKPEDYAIVAGALAFGPPFIIIGGALVFLAAWLVWAFALGILGFETVFTTPPKTPEVKAEQHCSTNQAGQPAIGDGASIGRQGLGPPLTP